MLVSACARADHGLIAAGTPKAVCAFLLTMQALLLSPGHRQVLIADLEGTADDRRSVVVNNNLDAISPCQREAFNRTTRGSCQSPDRLRQNSRRRRRLRPGRHVVRGVGIIWSHRLGKAHSTRRYR